MWGKIWVNHGKTMGKSTYVKSFEKYGLHFMERVGVCQT
jgi:hypothetical protein